MIEIHVNGTKVGIDNFLYNGTTYAPLRSVAEMLGKEVEWNSDTRVADIYDAGSRLAYASVPEIGVPSASKRLSITFPGVSTLCQYRFSGEEEWDEYDEPILINRNETVFARAFDQESQLLDEEEMEFTEIMPLEINNYYPKPYTEDFYPRYTYIYVVFSEDMQPVTDKSEISIKDLSGNSVYIKRVEPGINYADNLLFVVDNNLKLNTEYVLTVQPNVLASVNEKLYSEEIFVPFKTAHTVVKGKAYSDHSFDDTYMTLIGLDGIDHESKVSKDGGFCVTNMEEGTNKVKFVFSDGYIYETNIKIVSGKVNIKEFVCR
jgi:hypothetical protein